jgi:hypothetical protein
MKGDGSENDAIVLRHAQDSRSLALGDSAARAAFAAWVRESPANVEAFLTDTMLSVEFAALDSAGQFDLEKLIAIGIQQAQESTSTVKESED